VGLFVFTLVAILNGHMTANNESEAGNQTPGQGQGQSWRDIGFVIKTSFFLDFNEGRVGGPFGNGAARLARVILTNGTPISGTLMLLYTGFGLGTKWRKLARGQ
jgi:hypothetical protein